jgi:hypothetical protein
MSRKPTLPGVRAYFDTMREIFALESKVLSGSLPHYGERGANDELRVRRFLERVLPKKFSVGTGFVVCSHPSHPPSSQTDVVIFDEIQNSPLHREFSANVYPIEMVYATVEVKARLMRPDLSSISNDVAKIRSMAAQRRYVHYISMPKSPERPHEMVAFPQERPALGPVPRAYVFAFSQGVWKNPSSLKRSLERTARNIPSHIHGLIVLDRDWYFTQEAYAQGGPRFVMITKDALLHFVKGMIHGLSSMSIHQMAIDHYFTSNPS